MLPGTKHSIQFQAPPTFDVGYKGYFYVSFYIAGQTAESDVTPIAVY